MLRGKSCPWGWSLLHSSSPSTGSLRVGFMLLATTRDKRLQLLDILTPSEPGQS